MINCIFQRTVHTRLPTPEGQFQLYHYTNDLDAKEHLALVMGDLNGGKEVLVRVHSECFTGDVLGSQRCDCGEQLHLAMQHIAAEGRGVVIYLRQEGRGIGLQKKLQAYNLQDQGHDTVDANLLLGHGADERTYEAAVAILQDLGVQSLRLLTNNPHKIEELQAAGLAIGERIPLTPTVHAENQAYLTTKVQRMHHLLQLPMTAADTTQHQATALPAAALALVHDLERRAAAHYQRARTPFVTLSYAQSIDGSIAAADGTPLRISSDIAMRLTHMLRATHDAILVGVGTILADDPRLTVRLSPGTDPQPIILDSQLRTPPNARVLANQRPPWIATTDKQANHAGALVTAGAEIIPVAADACGHVSLHALLPTLADRGIRSIMVEGGATILGKFLQGGLAHAAVVTIAPMFVGGLHALGGTVSSRAPGRAAEQQQFPPIHQTQLLQLGPDLIYYGQLVTESLISK